MRWFVIVFLLLCLFPFVVNATSVNVPPLDQRTIFFSPNLEKDYSLSIGGASSLVVTIDGPLKRYFSVEDPNPGGGPRTIFIHIKLPERLDPGYYENRIVVTQGTNEGGTVGGVAAIGVLFPVIVLHKGKYIISTLSLEDTSLGGVLNGNINIKNYGEKDITNVYGEIFIPEIGLHFITNPSPLPSREEVTLKGHTTIPNTTRRGTYTGYAIVHYDGNEKSTNNASFRVGDLLLIINPLQFNITESMINKYVFEVKNEWDKSVKVKGKIYLNSTESVIPEFNIGPFSTKKITTYIDATNIGKGSYTCVITLETQGKSFSKEFILNVLEAEEEEKRELNIFTIIGIAFVILVLINIVLIFILLKKRK